MKDILEIQTGVKPMTLENYRHPVLLYVLDLDAKSLAGR